MSLGAPLTYAQESIFFLGELTNGRPVYHMPQAFRLRGKLDARALEEALRAVVKHHEALHTAIVSTSEGPRQTPVDADFRLALHNSHEQELTSRIADSIGAPFDLAGGKPFRADLFRISDDDHVLLLNLHHALGDMTSLGILFRDLGAAFAGDTLPPSLPNSEYATRRRAASITAETREFWRSSLREFTSELELPVDRLRPRLPSFSGKAIYHDFPAELTAGIKQLARAQKCSVYMICLAALQVMIHRYTGQDKFCVATPFSDRDDPALENTIGYLINLLPIPCTVNGEQPFNELLAVVRHSCLEGYANSNISFRQILKELNLASESPKPPLARVVFQYFPETPGLELPGLQSEQVRVHSDTAKFDLCVSLFEQGGRITAELEYDADLFVTGSVEAWARQFQMLLESIVAEPNGRCGQLNMVPVRDARHIAQWNDTTVAYPRSSTVHELFEAQAKLHPDTTALVFDSGKLSYRELDERANAIAAALQGRGVRRGDYVGVCLKRSPELIAALIGILKTGAAFVPFEVNYPKARLEYLFNDSGVRLLVTDSRNAHIAPAGKALLLVSRGRLSQFESQGEAADVAYVMYTSGSTGDPKGVMVPHRAITRLVKSNTFASFAAHEVWLAFAPVSFDASTLEIWAPLLNGGTLAIYPPEFESVEQFDSVLKRFKVTSLWLTAGLFNTIVDQSVEALRGVRQLLVGGDVLSVAHVRKALAALPDTELINGYGPTENTTFTCCFRIPRDWPPDRAIPIGKPIRNTRAHILDSRMQPVPIGVPGDLYTSGDGLSAGYLNKPDLTEAAFLLQNGERLYRTGDRARYLPEGDIYFLGRRDAQVKIRGFRIEIGEVESALRRIESVLDAAVVAHADDGGSKQLVAYVVPHPSRRIEPAVVKAEVGAFLPEHACPNLIIPLAELPLGPNGKVDKSALPQPGRLDLTETSAEAETPVQARLIEIFRQILEMPMASIDDNFFHCGGESLRATRAISQINRAFNCRLTLAKLFEAPTVRQMARVVEDAARSSENPMREPEGAKSGVAPIEIDQLSDDEVNDLLNQLIQSDDSAEPAKQVLS